MTPSFSLSVTKRKTSSSSAKGKSFFPFNGENLVSLRNFRSSLSRLCEKFLARRPSFHSGSAELALVSFWNGFLAISQATVGFEPTIYGGFANRCLEPLGYVAESILPHIGYDSDDTVSSIEWIFQGFNFLTLVVLFC